MTREERNLEIARLYVNERLSLRATADRVGLSHAGVRRLLVKAGIARRASSWNDARPPLPPWTAEHRAAHGAAMGALKVTPAARRLYIKLRGCGVPREAALQEALRG